MFPHDFIAQIRPIERLSSFSPHQSPYALELRHVPHSQHVDAVLHHHRSRRGGQRHDRDPRESLPNHGQFAIGGSEIVAPRGDAVRLVHNEASEQAFLAQSVERGLQSGAFLEELGREVEKLDGAGRMASQLRED